MLACNLARLSLESIKGNLLTYLKGAADVVYFCRLSDCHMLLQDIKPKRCYVLQQFLPNISSCFRLSGC